jgi:O-antigen ligase
MFKNYLNLQLFDSTVFKSFLIFFFIVSLLSGALLPDLIVSLSAIFFLIIYFNKDYFRSKYFFFFFIFWVYLIANSIFSSEPLESLNTSILHIRFLFFIFFINIFFSDRGSLRFVLYSFLFVYCILLVDGIYQLSVGHNIFGQVLDSSNRVSSFFGKKLILGSFISKTLSIPLFLIFFLRIKYRYFLYTFFILLSGTLVYLSRERSSFFVFFATFLFSFFLIEKKFILKIFFLIISLFFILGFFYNKPFDRLYSHTRSQLKETGSFFFSERHRLHYITGYKIFRDHPIFGGGVKSFRYLCDKDKYSVSDIIEANKNNVITSKKDGYYLYITNYELHPSGILYDAIFIIDKEFYNKYISNEKDDLISLKKILNSNHRYFIQYLIQHNRYFHSNYKNFDYVKSGEAIFTAYEFKNGCNTHPHNFYVQFLSEIGIVGFIFLFAFYYFIIKSLFIKIIKYIKYDKISHDIAIFGFYFSVFFPLIPSGNFFNNNNSLLLYLPLTFIILCQRK